MCRFVRRGGDRERLHVHERITNCPVVIASLTVKSESPDNDNDQARTMGCMLLVRVHV